MVARYRTLVTPLALIAAAILVYMENPWFFPTPGTTENQVATVAFWVLTIVVVVLMFEDRRSPGAEVVDVEGPAFARYLFSNTRRVAQDLGHGLDRRWCVTPRLLAEVGGGARPGLRADHLRLVPVVSAGPDR